MGIKKPVVLCILDGWGLRTETAGNAVAQAHTPTFDSLMSDAPNTTLTSFGPDVGLPAGQMGNSEVGHMNIGAGRVVEMDLRRIDASLERGDFGTRPAMVRFLDAVKAKGGRAHLCGVLSDGGVHSHIDHMVAAARVCRDAGLDVILHLFTDGRDVAPKSALTFLRAIDGFAVGTVTGRYYALDRDNRWDRVETAYNALVHGTGQQQPSAKAAIEAAYADGKTDEFIPASIVEGYGGINSGDGLLFLNFRADRARQILAAIGDPEFDAFATSNRPRLSALTGFAEYSDRHNTYMDCVFPTEDIQNTLGAWVAHHGKTQFRIAETEKYPHVTFFLNGGVEVPHTGETRYLAPSPKVATYDLQPEMSAAEVTEHLTQAIQSQEYDLVVANYANPDMVGHTGDLKAAIAACEAVDRGLARVRQAVQTAGGALIVTADHGNCETMTDTETGQPHTAHTLNPVPCCLVGGPEHAALRDGGRLADLAPTLLELMGLPQPPEMTGQSLLT